MNSIEKALTITSAFEGAGWGGVSNAGDGMGWSAFTLQWNFGQGTLQGVLKAMRANGPATFARCCTQPVEQMGGKAVDLSADLLHACDLSTKDAIAWCQARQDTHGRPLPHWRAVFKALGEEPGFRRVQLACAGRYINTARNLMVHLGLKTERAFAFCFDLAVQNGSIDETIEARYKQAIAALVDPSEPQKLAALAQALITEVRLQYRADVLSRKMCIATGAGTVHGRAYNLASQYGLGDGSYMGA